jgi:hypothetical protein
MLEILPIQSKSEQEALAARCGIKYDRELLAYSAMLDGKSVGICQFSLKPGSGHITDLSPMPGVSDFEAMFILGRAALNFIDLCGVHEAYYDGQVNDETLICAIGFSKNSDGRYYVNLTDFFTKPCQNCKK